MDADNAFGHLAGLTAVKYGSKIANKLGICAVSVINSSHPGAMASIALSAARKGIICLAFTHADSLIRSTNGKRSFFGTNPICFAVPRMEKEPYCLDMATSIISWNKLLEMKKIKKNISSIIGSDLNGKDTKILNKIVSLNPTGDYKGFGLASMVEILCGVYSGMAFGRQIVPMYTSSIKKKRKLAQFYLLLKADGVLKQNTFLKRMQNLTNSVRKEPRVKKNKSVVLPNDPELLESKIRLKKGIPLSNDLFINLKKLSNTYKINLKLI